MGASEFQRRAVRREASASPLLGPWNPLMSLRLPPMGQIPLYELIIYGKYPLTECHDGMNATRWSDYTDTEHSWYDLKMKSRNLETALSVIVQF